jgi:CheY-like chemotaxis protein
MNEIARILLVEDNGDDAEATSRSLKMNHLLNPLHWCRGGQDALDYLAGAGAYANDPNAGRPALILLDLNMPGVDGRQVLERVKSTPALRSIPVIILTTSADATDIEQCYALGASTFIQKPVDFDGLSAAVRAMRDYWFGIALLPAALA